MTKYPKLQRSIHLPPKYAQVIGELTINAALMDQLIDHTIAVFLGTSPTIGRLITDSILSTTRKIKLLEGIADEIPPEGPLKDQFHDVCSKLQSAQAHRSKIVHARWGHRPKTDAYYVVTFEPGEKRSATETMPLSRLEGYGREVAQAYRALEKFLDSIDFVPGKKGKHAFPAVYRPHDPTKK